MKGIIDSGKEIVSISVEKAFAKEEYYDKFKEQILRLKKLPIRNS